MPLQPFYDIPLQCINQGWIYCNMAQYQLGPRAQIVKLSLVFPYIWQKDLAKILKVPGAQRDVNPARQ